MSFIFVVTVIGRIGKQLNILKIVVRMIDDGSYGDSCHSIFITYFLSQVSSFKCWCPLYTASASAYYLFLFFRTVIRFPSSTINPFRESLTWFSEENFSRMCSSVLISIWHLLSHSNENSVSIVQTQYLLQQRRLWLFEHLSKARALQEMAVVRKIGSLFASAQSILHAATVILFSCMFSTNVRVE